MSLNRSPRRHRVVLRPKVRSQRLRQLAAAGALACLGGLALLTILQFKRDGAEWGALKSKLAPTLRSVAVEGAPAGLEERLQSYVESRPDDAVIGTELLAAFPCLKTVDVSKNYWRGRRVYRVALRGAVGVAASRSGAPRYLDGDGTVFEAPVGLYAIASPTLALDGAAADELKRLAAFLPEAAKPGALPSALASMSFVSAADGWRAQLSDGAVVLWGDLRFTREKLARLREILADARSQFGGVASADLRYFEDGRALVRPKTL